MKSKLKVLATIPGSFCFGLQYVSVDLFAATSECIEPHFLITRWNDGVFESLVKRHNFTYSFSWLGMFSRKLDWRNVRMSLITLSRLPQLYYDFVKLIRSKKPDILFFANHHELILLMPVLIFTRKKVVCHMHDPSPVMFFQKMNFLLYGLRVNHFIAISYDVQRRLMMLGCPQQKISVIHNGIQLPAPGSVLNKNLFKTMFQWPDDSFVVGITGQMTQTKGHQDLVEAFSIACKRNSKLRLVIGGKSLEPLFSMLKDQIDANGLHEVVRFSGWMENASDFYSSIDLLVLASRHDEGYGLVVAEMMSFKKPVLITRSGGAAEIVEDGISGYIVSKMDAQEMADKMYLLSVQPELYRSFGQQAFERIKSEFSIEVAAGKFVEKLNSINRSLV